MLWMQAALQNIKNRSWIPWQHRWNKLQLSEFRGISYNFMQKDLPLKLFLCIILTCTESFTGVTRRNGGTNGYFIN